MLVRARVLLLVLGLVLYAMLSGCAPGARSPGGGALAANGLPGSRLRLRLPDGFDRPTRALSMINRELRIVVSLLEGTMSPADTEAAMRGMVDGVSEKVIDRTSTPVRRGDAEGFVVGGRTSEGSQRMLVALHGGNAFGGVVIDYNPAAEVAAHAIADSIWLDVSAPLDLERLYGLTLGKADGLVVWDAMSTPIMIKEVGAKPPIPPTSASLMVMVIPAPTKEVMKNELVSLFNMKKVTRETLENQLVEIDGGKAAELIGDAHDKAVPLKFFATVMDDPGSMIIAMGSYAPNRPKDLERLRAIVRGLHRIPGTIGPVHLP